MSFGWSGADPAAFNDPGATYELGTRYTASANITITGLRIWAPPSSSNLSNRKGYIRLFIGGTVLSTVSLPTSLTSGWNVYLLPSPVDINSGVSFWATYGTFQDYGATTGVTYPVPSSDSAVVAQAGAFGTILGDIPGTLGTNFYGIDILYSLRLASLPPAVTAVIGSNSNRAVGLSVSIVDEVPSTVTITVDWGDGSSPSISSGPGTRTHTYSQDGTFAISVLAVDADGGVDVAAVPVTVRATVTSAVANAAEMVLAAFQNAFAGSAHVPAIFQVTVGQEIAADIDAFTDACCQGLAVLMVTEGALEPGTVRDGDGVLYSKITVDFLVFRCAPTIGDDLRTPTPAEHLAYSRIVLDDMERMMRGAQAVHDFPWITEEDVSDPTWQAIPVDGGCGGGAVSFEMAVIGNC